MFLGSLFLRLGAATRVAHANSFLLSVAGTLYTTHFSINNEDDMRAYKTVGEVEEEISLCAFVGSDPQWDSESASSSS